MAAGYARLVGGGSVHFTANHWRLHPEDFRERSVLGEIPGASLADWPITYEELEPWYTKANGSWAFSAWRDPTRSMDLAPDPTLCLRCR